MAASFNSIANFLSSISSRSSESDVGHKFIIPLLHFLGYKDDDWRTQVKISKSRLDFLVCPQDIAVTYPAYLAIEVKAPKKKLAQSAWQIHEYMRQSGAILGLLTNGYSFHLVYNYQGQIVKIVEYSQVTLATHFNLFYQLLCKETCLKFSTATLKSQQKINLKFLAIIYDYIFIDPPPSFGKVNGISLMASSGILIPTQLSPYPIRALEYVMEQAKEVEDFKDEPLPILGIAVSMYDQKSTSFNLSMAEEIREILAKNSESHKISLFPENTWIPRLNIVSHCPDKGYPIHQTEFDDNLSQQEREAAQKAITRYENLAAQLISLRGCLKSFSRSNFMPTASP